MSQPDAIHVAAVSLGRRGGLKGGIERANRLTAEERRAIALKANAARWGKLHANLAEEGLMRPLSCERCGCSPTRHNKRLGGCQNIGCDCPKAVRRCRGCDGWASAYSSGRCSACYVRDSETQKKEAHELWLAQEPERETLHQLRALKRGHRTLTEIRSLLEA